MPPPRLDKALQLAIKVLTKTCDATTLTPDKFDLATLTVVDGKVNPTFALFLGLFLALVLALALALALTLALALPLTRSSTRSSPRPRRRSCSTHPRRIRPRATPKR